MISEKHSIYGSMGSRIKAIIVDSLVLVAFGISTSILLQVFGNVPDKARIIPFIFIFFLCDPLCTSLFGGTIGHLFMGLRVKEDKNHAKNIFFHYAIIRFLIKLFLGWISLLTVATNHKNKSIHDLFVGSVVLKIKEQ